MARLGDRTASIFFHPRHDLLTLGALLSHEVVLTTCITCAAVSQVFAFGTTSQPAFLTLTRINVQECPTRTYSALVQTRTF